MVNEKLRRVIAWLIAQDRASSQRDLALMLGYNPSAFSQIVNGRVPLSEKFLNRLATFEPRLNTAWIKGKGGEMLVFSTPDAEQMGGGQEAMTFYAENKYGARFYKQGDRLLMTVRHVPYAAFGRFANDSDRLDRTSDDWGYETYEVDLVAHGHYLSFDIQGDSMDIGTRESFEAGDKVLVRELEREHWREGFRYEDHPYWVVVFDSSVLIKQMVAQDLEKGTLTFHSLNPSPEYADFTLDLDSIRNLFYVVKKKPRERTF